jgi:hypothetical protein
VLGQKRGGEEGGGHSLYVAVLLRQPQRSFRVAASLLLANRQPSPRLTREHNLHGQAYQGA